MFLSAKFSQAAVLIVLAALLAGAVWYTGGASCRAKVEKARADALEEARQKSDEIQAKYYAAKRKLENDNAELRKSISTLVEDIPVCQYSSDVILQLDKARGVSPAATDSARTAAAPATDLSRPGAADRWAADALQCNLWREQLLALIEWHSD